MEHRKLKSIHFLKESTGKGLDLKKLQKFHLLNQRKILEILIILKKKINGMKSIEPPKEDKDDDKEISIGLDIPIRKETRNK
jgi:hypothetical protein